MLFDEGGRPREGMPAEIIEVEKVDPDLRKKVVEQGNASITDEDIDWYVEILIHKLKLLKSEKEKVFLIKKAVESEGGLINIEETEEQSDKFITTDLQNAFYASSVEMLNQQLAEVRERVIKRLQERLKELSPKEGGLQDEDIHFLFSNQEDVIPRPHIQHVKSVAGHEGVLRTDRLELNEHDSKIAHEAFLHLAQLPHHENILDIKYYTPDTRKKWKTIVEKLNLKNVYNLVEDTKSSAEDIFNVLRDCVVGATFLKDNGLVLLDISPSNLGMVTDDKGKKRGILFDL